MWKCRQVDHSSLVLSHYVRWYQEQHWKTPVWVLGVLISWYPCSYFCNTFSFASLWQKNNRETKAWESAIVERRKWASMKKHRLATQLTAEIEGQRQHKNYGSSMAILIPVADSVAVTPALKKKQRPRTQKASGIVVLAAKLASMSKPNALHGEQGTRWYWREQGTTR